MRYPRILLSLCLVGTLALTWSLAAATPSADAPTPPPLPDELTLPDPELMAPCSASLDCEDGNVISCTGNSVCQANQFDGYVECDGQRTTCPNFCKAVIFCSCACGATKILTCSSLSGDCQQGGGSITCDGFTKSCVHACTILCR